MTDREQWIRDYEFKNAWRRDLPQEDRMVVIVQKGGLQMHVTVERGVVTAAWSPQLVCFKPNFIGEQWEQKAQEFRDDGFTVERGN